ncbi:MAG: DMT family transporter [Candidatus Cloacimonetes bacterium]|nr:DMT family transporter [Candidatus Cloacimonadota bacterium]MBT6994182.1 DMT family transporter [Candidatus Cloacimonadota bacterium]MBT7469729.1 DMT family transporter [Candidatus Cloacimonadota bacterium]
MDLQKRAYIYAIIAVLFWSTVASAFKIALRSLDFLQLLLYSSLVSVITTFLILLTQHKLKVIKQYSKQEYLSSALLGFLNPFLYYVILFKAYSLLPAQEAQPLNYTWPIVLVLLSIPLLKQRVGASTILAITISFIGVLIISTHGNILSFRFTNLTGASLALGSTIIWALFWIYNIKDKRDEVAKIFLNFVFGFIYILVATLLFSKIILPDISGLLSVTYVGIFEMGITFVVWSKALKLSKTTAKVSNLIYFAPFLSLVVIYLIVGEKILFSTIVGLICIVVGILIQQYKGYPNSWKD